MELDYAEIGKRLASALDTTPDEFLIGSTHRENENWRDVAEMLRNMNTKELSLAKSFLSWILEQRL